MRNCFLFVSLFLLTALVACKDTKWVELPSGNPPEGAITGKPGEDAPDPVDKTLINCSYIRGGLFEQGRISAESMAACNDLIFLAARPYADGGIAFELPQNDVTLVGGTSYEATYNGRSGVMKFDGTGKLNAGDGLLHSADGAFTQFTFATYIYIDQWVDGAYLFKKADTKSTIAALQLGATEGKLSLILGGKPVASFNNATLTAGAWHYLAVDYTGTKLRYFVDSNPVVELEVALTIPNTVVDFYIGENFKGRLDETAIFSISAGTSAKNGIDPTTWVGSKALAYWKYDDATNPGKDTFTWVNTLEKIRASLNGKQGERKLRLGVAGGSWKEMVANEGARSTFAYNLKALLEKYKLDGADLDFEWPENSADYSNYSTAIVKIRSILGKDVFFTVSLHPVSFKITKAAINAVDFISYQCYGPATMRFPLQQFKDDAKAAIDYGIPADKLVMGVPFIGTTGMAGEQVGYRDFVTQGGLTDPALDQITYNGKNYVFNGQNTIRLKTLFSCTSGFRGIMSWDLATDLTVTNPLSLLKIVKEELDNYSASTQQK